MLRTEVVCGGGCSVQRDEKSEKLIHGFSVHFG